MIQDIAFKAKANINFRQVLESGVHTQIVIMSIPVGGDIGEETHTDNDQVLFLVAGEGKVILNGLNLSMQSGSIHAVMGPNGAGKSTLAKVLAGDPSYEIVQGDILFQGESLIDLEPEERAHKGLFMGFQYPIEIPGITKSSW